MALKQILGFNDPWRNEKIPVSRHQGENEENKDSWRSGQSRLENFGSGQRDKETMRPSSPIPSR